MAINLSKGQRVTLDNTMKMALVGLGWSTNPYGGAEPDLDASIFMVGADGRCTQEDDFIYYNHKDCRNGAVHHMGDARVAGAGDDDDEQIIINFERIPPEIQKLVVCVTIFDYEKFGLNFGQVNSAYVRVAKLQNEFDTQGVDQLRFDLVEEFSTETALVVCEIYRYGNEWKFNAVAAGCQGGLAALVNNYGLSC